MTGTCEWFCERSTKVPDLKTMAAKMEKYHVDLKDALTEIENRGNAIEALKGAISSFASLLDEALFPRLDGPQTPIEELKKKAKKLLVEAHRQGLHT